MHAAASDKGNEMLSHYHAGVYGLVYKKRWSCCGLQRMAPGCSTTSVPNESKGIDAAWLLKSSHVHGYLFSYSVRLLSFGPSLAGLVLVEWNFSSNHACWVNSVLMWSCRREQQKLQKYTTYPWHTDRAYVKYMESLRCFMRDENRKNRCKKYLSCVIHQLYPTSVRVLPMPSIQHTKVVELDATSVLSEWWSDLDTIILYCRYTSHSPSCCVTIWKDQKENGARLTPPVSTSWVVALPVATIQLLLAELWMHRWIRVLSWSKFHKWQLRCKAKVSVFAITIQ